MIGKYVCIAHNRLGNATKTFELRNGTKPNPPQRFIVKGVNASNVHIEVEQEEQPGQDKNTTTKESINEDEYDEYNYLRSENNKNQDAAENEVITGYRFQFISLDHYNKYRERNDDEKWYPDGVVEKTYTNSNSYVVGGLKANTVYMIKVASVNLAGPSDYSRVRKFSTNSGSLLQLQRVVTVVLIAVWSAIFVK